MTDFEKVSGLFTELGIRFHLLEENGWKYIQKLKLGESEGYLDVKHTLVPLKHSGQLTDFFEFHPDGSLASW